MNAQATLPGMAGAQQNPATVYLDVDGKPHPAADCHWIEIAPCGCIGGVARAGDRVGANGQPVVYTTGADAFFQDKPKVVREYELSQGLRFQLITHQQYSDTYMELMKGSCPHTPTWGHTPVPLPEGWTWQCSDGIGRRTHRKHIVPAEIPEGHRGKIAALCGNEDYGFAWGGDWHHLMDTVPCKKCIKHANDTSPGLPGVVDVPTGDAL